MPSTLQSYTQGRWEDGSGDIRPLLDASTGEPVAFLPTDSPDPAEALSYAREVGSRQISQLTFTERASILKALARSLSSHLDEFVSLSSRTGATRRDTAVDVDGGIGTVAVYASLGARHLPNETVLADGDMIPLGRGDAFAGGHLFTSRLGAAVQINAFNFPVWGMLEKFAPAFLAGMASVVKPAAPTAYLTELVVRRIVDSDLLPEGSLSLICAGPAGLLDALGPQDTLAFTGSSSVAETLRRHPAVVGRGVPLNVEADSLNCSVLGPDVRADDPEFELYVDQLVTEMTVKAGQKCTAIRRALVPAGIVDQVTAAAGAALETSVVGHPSLPDTTMGPLVSLTQREEVRSAVARLRASADLVFGDPEKVQPVGADAERGAFLTPLLLRCADSRASEPHDIEPFGPVATILPYDDPEDLAAVAARGQGSLVASIVTADADFARRMVRDLAPWHGRLLVVDRNDADASTGHGIAMPQMLHGGPGRAGGGAELGGLRAVQRYMRLTAVQGFPPLLRSLTPDPSPTPDT